MSYDSKRLNEAHNDGQEDRSEGKPLDKPHSELSMGGALINPLVSSREYKTRQEENEAYVEGYKHTEDQISDSSSCCYIVSACLDDLGIPRNCPEMIAMKTLTKNHILRSFSGKRDYVLYGRIGPKIVRAIREAPTPRETWRQIYSSLREIAETISLEKYPEAHQKYKSLVHSLEARFVR